MSNRDIHIHNWINVTTLDDDIEVEMCAVSDCFTPYRWRWSDHWDWMETDKDPRHQKKKGSHE